MKKTFLIIALSISILLNGQNKSNLEKTLNTEDSTALVTIANYPDSLRTDILVACREPSFLVKTELLQKNSSQSFRTIVENYSKEDQKNLWDLTRYPNLISEIVISKIKTKEDIKTIANKYPKEIQPAILKYSEKYYNTIVAINNLYINTNLEYEKIIASYPIENIKSYRKLINHPDILNVLSTNMHLSVILGNMYSTDQKHILNMLDSIKIKQDIQIEKEKKEWKEGLEKNPEAEKEMEQVAREYINKETNIDLNDDDVYSNSTSNKNVDIITTNAPLLNATISPYPYWFGYPYWYEYPYWYPYPYWYNFGFYWGSSGIVYVGLPSPYFMNWYFFNPHHHFYYSNFSDYCIGHHYNHYEPRFQRTDFNSEIHRWEKANEPNLPKGYLNSDVNRPNRIKELGRFEMNYQSNTKSIFGRNITRSEFLQNNSNYYPQLNPVINQSRFNQRINYPKQQSPIKYNMEQPRNSPSHNQQNKNRREPSQKMIERNSAKPRR